MNANPVPPDDPRGFNRAQDDTAGENFPEVCRHQRLRVMSARGALSDLRNCETAMPIASIVKTGRA